MQVLDKGILELKQATQQMDYSVLAAARVSNGGIFEEASKGEEQDQKLINYLMRHKHGTPFEHNLFTFYVKCPLFVRSEWHRHRIGWSYNEISGRYVEFEPEFYIPAQWRIQGSSTKQGSVVPDDGWRKAWWEKWEQWPEWMRHPQDVKNDVNQFHSEYFDMSITGILTNACSNAYKTYKLLLENGVAKEMARMVLPQNMYTEFYATCNARSLMHFLNLRTSETAQLEIRMYALAMESIFKDQMPLTYKAWAQNERVSP